jgi:hypothetical protein
MTAVQQGIALAIQSQTNTVSIGNVVTDVNIQPYIAPRVVAFFAYGLRPNHTVHVFFDSVLVDQYCIPGIAPSSIADTSNPNSIQPVVGANIGDPIITNQYGVVAGLFNIPAATFKTGDRLLEIADVTNLAQGNAAISTSASATFTASNLSVTKENITLTTINPQVSVVPVTNTVVTVTSANTITIHPDIGLVTGAWYEPIAQGLTISTPSGEAGIFATSIDLYFMQKSQVQQNGVTVYICETNNGYPDGSKVLPFSTSYLPWGSINANSSGPYQATTFTFESPVFLNNGTEYAFVVKPDAGDPDYWVYSANLGDTDIITGTQVVSQPTIGTAFYGATSGEWTALQTEYIMFDLKRAAFANSGANAYFVNTPTEYLTAFNVGYVNTSVGILPGDVVIQASNSTVSNATVNTSIRGIVNYYDTVKNVLYLEHSTGNFTPNSFIQVHRGASISNGAPSWQGTFITSISPNTSTLIAYANTGSLYNPIMDAFVPQFAAISPAGTSLTYNVKGISNTYSADSKYIPVTPGTETEFYDQERIIASRTNEVNNNSGSPSLSIRADMTTDSEFLSPLIDTVRRQELVIGNSLDPIKFIYEEFFNSGSSKSKYVSKIVTLANGQDSQDIQIILDAYRPLGSDIQVWVKFLNAYDTDPISMKTWTPLINTGVGVYSDPSNPNDVKEFTFTIPQYYGPLPTNGTITVANTSTTVTGSGTQFGTDVKVGWYVNMLANSTFSEITRKVVAIANTTSLTLDNPFYGNYTAQPYFVVAPPTTPWLSANTLTAISGTVSTYTTNNAIVGSGTNFTSLTPGQIIAINGDEQNIVSITNSTFLTVGTPWNANNSANIASIISPNGLTYLNSNYAQYSTYKQFQIKVILQSNDTSHVPLMKNIRALAMQL